MIRKIKVAIDSPAAAGAGTIAKAISKYFNLLYLDTGKIYRFIAFLKIKFPEKYSYKFIKRKIKGLKLKDLNRKERNAFNYNVYIYIYPYKLPLQ